MMRAICAALAATIYLISHASPGDVLTGSMAFGMIWTAAIVVVLCGALELWVAGSR